MTSPTSAERYQLPSYPATDFTRELWNAVFGDIADRLDAREALEASFEALEQQGIQASLDYVQATLAPQIVSLQESITLAQDQIDQIIIDGVSPDAEKLGGKLPSHYATQEALTEGLSGKVPNERTVNGQELSSNITLSQSDVGLDQVDNTRDADKPVSTPQAEAMAALQPIASRGVLSGFRNKLINPNFEISQRGNTFSIPPTGVAYTADRWRIVNNTDQTLEVTCPARFSHNGNGNLGRLRLKFNTAPTTGDIFVMQRIEGASTLAGKQVTAGFLAFGDGFDASFVLFQSFGSGGSATVNTGYQYVTVVPGGTEARFIDDIPSTDGKVFGTGDHLNYQIGLPIRSTEPVTLTRNFLVEGDATADDDAVSERHIQQEYGLCQRYFQVGYILIQGVSPSSGIWKSQGSLTCEMRVSPTVSALADDGSANSSRESLVPSGGASAALGVNVTSTGPFWRHCYFNCDAEI